VPDVKGVAIVSDRQPTDDALRAAFQALGEASHKEISAADLELIWRAVSEDLPAVERRELVDRTASDPALAEAWRAARELRRAAGDPAPAAVHGLSVWRRSWLAAAAVLLIGASIAIVFRLSPASRDETFRDADHYVVEPLVQADDTLPRDAFRLRWRAGPPESRYRVRVTTEDLQILTTASDLTVPELLVDAALLSRVAPGSRVLWQVDVTLPGGESISSQTFRVRVR
jgi:hypothetical protein